MKNLVREYDDYEPMEPKFCIAHQFSSVYPDCVLSCGGCLYCRKHAIISYESPLPLEIDLILDIPTQAHLHGELLLLMGWRSVLNLLMDDVPGTKSSSRLNNVLVGLVGAGVQQLLLPSALLQDDSWMRQLVTGLAKHSAIPHLIRSIDDVLNKKQLPLYLVPTMIVYPTNDSSADIFHRSFHSQLQQWQNAHVPLIFVVSPSLYLESEHGKFIDRIDGNTYYLSDLENLLTRWQEPVL